MKLNQLTNDAIDCLSMINMSVLLTGLNMMCDLLRKKKSSDLPVNERQSTVGSFLVTNIAVK